MDKLEYFIQANSKKLTFDQVSQNGSAFGFTVAYWNFNGVM